LPDRLVHDIVDALYREDRFYRGTLAVCGRKLGPAGLGAAEGLPTLIVINTADEIAPLASVAPFVEAVADGACASSNMRARRA
jgi:polyhydroxyalkanoate synthase